MTNDNQELTLDQLDEVAAGFIRVPGHAVPPYERRAEQYALWSLISRMTNNASVVLFR